MEKNKMPLFNPTLNISQYYPWARNLLFPTEANGLYTYSLRCKNIVEIGVFEGASACIFKKSMHRYGYLWLIDPFIPDSMNSKIKARKWITKLNIFLTFPLNRTVLLFAKKSTDLYFSQSIDFLFIDGDHSEEGTFQDWEKFSPLLIKGGIAALHDSFDFSDVYPPARGHDGPKKLRKKLFTYDKNYKLINTIGTISFFEKVF